VEPVNILRVLEIARQAGQAILEIYAGDAHHNSRKADGSPLTEADLAAHRIIVEGLQQAFPGIPILSEESAQEIRYAERRDWKRFWLVDPLDGTKDFLKRNGQFTVNIALIEDSHPVAGVVYAPVLDVFYFRHYRAEAYKLEHGELRQLPPRHWQNPTRLRIVGSLMHPTPELEAFVAEQHQIYPEVEFVRMGSSLKICLVAEGVADLYPRLGPTMEWDTAAAHAVAEGAGCTVFQYPTGAPLRYNKPDLHNPWFLVAPAGYTPAGPSPVTPRHEG